MRNQPPHDRVVQGEEEGMKIQPSFKFGGLDMAFKGSPFRSSGHVEFESKYK